MKEKNAKKSRDTANLRASWQAPGFNSIGSMSSNAGPVSY